MEPLYPFRNSLIDPFFSFNNVLSFLSATAFIDPFFPFRDYLSFPVVSFQWWPLLTHAFLSVTVTSFTDSFFPFSEFLHLPVLSYQWWTSLTQAFLSVTTFIDPFFLSVTTFIDPLFTFSDDLHRCDRLLRRVKHSAAGSGKLLHLRSCGHLRHICPPGF